jgi:4-amino-4-deoxy-L-arabinose transferase-like glycosyltransferase
MQTVGAWGLMLVVIGAGYGWAAWLMRRNPRRAGLWLTVCLTLAVAVGGLSLVMLWLSLAGIGFSLWGITLVVAVVMLPGWVLFFVKRPPHPRPLSRQGRGEKAMSRKSPRPLWERGFRGEGKFSRLRVFASLRLIASISLLVLAAAILFNAVYWPFSRADALGIYHPQAVEMTATRQLIPLIGADSLYRAYPMQIQLIYTYTYIASGWENEYLARLIPALLSLGCLPAAYTLGRMIHGELAGWLSAILSGLTPMFGRWASSGYVDLPMAFFYVMAAIFAWRLWQTRHWTDALLAGAMMGLAAWTKNAALIGIGVLGLWLGWSWLKGRINIRLIVLSLGACAVIAAPWYIRNLIGAGFLMPDTAWIADARPTIENLFIFILHPEIFGYTGWVMLTAWIATLIAFIRRRGESETFLLVWTIPFFAMWWLFASYDPRFLLLFLPLLAVMGGIWLARSVPVEWRSRLAIPAAGLLLITTAYMLWISVEFKDNIARDPLMSNEARHQVVAGE